MLYKGDNIKGLDNILTPISIENLLELISTSSDLERKVSTLQSVRRIDEKKYRILKTQLPYITCACFNPASRKTENFAYISYFMVDIDHVSSLDMDIAELKTQLTGDSMVMLCYKSPSGDGLKLLFRLKERCYDVGIFKIFYRQFIKIFAQKYNIEDIIDGRTNDVTRASFISYDRDAYYNPSADTVDLNSIIDLKNTDELFDMQKEMDKEDRKSVMADVSAEKEPDKDTLAQIKQTLGLLKAKPVNPDVYVPEQLTQIISQLTEFLSELNIDIQEIIDISYGKKIKVKVEDKQAECNIFYGKKGFSVVISPRRGTDKELNELIQQLIANYLR